MTERVRFVVVGAGVTGLAFADRVPHGECLVLEADREIGGYCKTVVRDGFVWDYSGHFFHFRHPEIERELVARMAPARVLRVVKDARIWWNGSWIDFPFQKNIHQLPKEEFIDCLVDLHFRPRDVRPSHFREMLEVRFGRSIADKFLVPYNEKLYATDLSRLDVDAMGRFFPYADEDEIIRNFRRPDNASYNTTFTYPEGGAIQYVRALAGALAPGTIETEEPVVRIDLDRRIAVTPRRHIAFEHLVSTAPFPTLLRMTGLPHDPSPYDWNRVLVFNLGFDRKGPERIHWAYVPQRELCFYRVGFYDNIFGADRMSLYVEIGRSRHDRLQPDDIEALRARVLEDLRRMGIVRDHRLVAEHHVVLDPAYVHITKDSQRDVAEKKALLAAHGVHSIGRYGSWTYCSIEDNIVEARALADRLLADRSA
ncbi:MAG: FAD-dependent oxidoreductase [Myxococcota bacterium]|nr:FAD-dependent oxidoreductase [Myxococcota bacterium]